MNTVAVAALSEAASTMTGGGVIEVGTIEDFLEVRQSYHKERLMPDPKWVRGACPLCGGDVVANCYYVGGRGYLCVHECWESLGDGPSCHYRKVL